MCQNHSKLFGSESVVELEAIVRHQIKACAGRTLYVEQQVEGYKKWLESTGQDVEKVIEMVIFNHFDREQDVSDIQVDGSTAGGINTEEVRMELEKDAQDSYWGMVWGCVNKSQTKFWSIEQRLQRVLSYWEGQEDYASKRLEALKKEIALTDKIQDALDNVAVDDRSRLLKFKARLNVLMNNKEISWDSFVVMTNQIHRHLGWKEIQSKFQSRNVADVVAYWERAAQWAQMAQSVANQLFVELQPLVGGEELELDEECGEFKSAQLFGQITWGFSGQFSKRG
jgi:hypothetical protein